MNCKIQTLCVNTNISVSFTPPEVMDEDCVKILYYLHQNFTMCQRVLEIRMNEGNNDSSRQMKPDFSELCFELMHWHFMDRDYYVIYGFDYSLGIYEVEIYKSLSLLQKFERFFEKIPRDSSIAFIFNTANTPFVPFFVKALLGQLGRKPPIDAGCDTGMVQTWLSTNEARRDIIAHSSTLNNMKAEFIINLSSNLPSMIPPTRNATSKCTHICFSTPSTDELKAMIFLSSEKNKQSDSAYSMHRDNMKRYLRRTNF